MNKKNRCFVCKINVFDRAHIKSRGSGGCDEEWNIMHLCRTCHTRQHKYGWVKFSEVYPEIHDELISRGFSICTVKKRWVREVLNE